MTPFALYDCSLARCAVGRSCANLRELLEAVRTTDDNVIEHHLMRCVLEDYFELNEFPNDFARWAWEALGDPVLAEQLGLIDPYRFASSSEVRERLIDVIEQRLWGLDRVPWCRPGLELHLIESRLIGYDTGERIVTPTALANACERMSSRSLFFHVHEAHVRTKTDDFSLWLEGFGAGRELIEQIRNVDFHFLNLSQLRNELHRLLSEASFAKGVPQ